MATMRKIKRTVKRTVRRKNVASGRTTGRGAGRVFQPFRSSPDYDPARAGEGKPKKKRKPAAKKTAKKAATKRKTTTAKRKPVARKTAIRKAVAKKRAVTKRRPVVKSWRKNPGPLTMFGGTNGPTIAQARTAGTKYGSPSSDFSSSSTEAWDSYKRAISTHYMDSVRLAVVKKAFLAGWKAAKGGVKNPKPRVATKTYQLVWSPTGQKIGTVTAANMKAAIRKAPAPYKKYLGEIYAEVVGAKNPKKATAKRANPQMSMVGKSRYKATMDKAKALMPFSATVAKGWTGDYFLSVNKQNVAMARSILNAMAKTMTKKATKATKK